MAALPRSCKLLCSGREEASRLKEAQVRHRFVVTTLVSPTPGETKKWGSLSLCQLRKRWASPPKDVSTGSPRSQGNDYAEWRSRSERLSRVGNRRPRLSSPEGAADLGAGGSSPGLQPWVSLGSWKKQIKRKAESRTAGAIPAPLSPTTVVPIHLKEKCSYSRCCGGLRVLPRRTSEISSGSRLLEASAHRRSYASNG